MSINNKLITFATQELVLAHNDTERDRIKGSVGQLEKILKDKLSSNIKEFVRFGSFTRNTILPRKYDTKSDVDLMVVFNTTNGKKTPSTYRKNLHDIIAAAYPNSISKKDFPSVKLELNHIMFDIVPAYSEESAWLSNKYYYIPDLGDGWRSTTPNDINETLASKNQIVGNNTIRNIIRLCKHWNAGANYPFESYLMEKDILNVTFWGSEDTYSGFLKVMNSIAGSRAGVRQALDYIEQYKGGLWTTANEPKQIEWLQKLLPGLN
jgi:predicted nucleotidyltransferase